jgi:PAS domain S-box-containing protein
MSIQGYRVDGSGVYWNAASEKIYGYSSKEALGQTLYDLIIPQDMGFYPDFTDTSIKRHNVPIRSVHDQTKKIQHRI